MLGNHHGRALTGSWRRIGFGLVTIVALAGAASAHAGWTLLNSGTSLDLFGVDAVDATTAYVVGDRAAFLHPVATGSLYGFTEQAGCTAAHDCVNDQADNAATGAPLAPNSRDYVADSAGNRAMFAPGNGLIPGGHRVVGLRVYLAPTQDTGPMASLGSQRVGIDAAPVDSPNFWVANYWVTGWAAWSWTGLTWTPADVDALGVGVKSVVGERLEAGQVFTKIYYEPLP